MGSPLTAAPMRAARWSAEHPGRAILAWIAFVAVAVGLAAAVPSRETTEADYRLGESGRAGAMITAAGLDAPDVENILVAGGGGGRAGERRAAATATASRARAIEGVLAVGDPQPSADGSALLVSVQVDDAAAAHALQRVTRDIAAAHPALEVRQAGDVTIDEAIGRQVADDLGSAELTSLPVTLLLMLVAFGALIAAGIPVLLAFSSVAATIGLMAPLSHLVPSEDTVGSMIVLIGMAVGVDYSLFYLKREREERAKGRATLEAVEIAAQTSGHSILVSGGAVVAAMAGLFVVGDATFDSLAVGSILVVAVAVLGSITVLPALLVKLGRWSDRPRVPLLWRLNRHLTQRLGRGGISTRLLGPVLRHPVVSLLLSSAVVVGLAVPALGLRTHSATLETLPTSIPEVQTVRAISDRFPADAGAAVVVVAQGEAGERERVAASLERLADDAAATGAFVPSDRGIETSPDGRTSKLVLGMPYDEVDDRVVDGVRALRTDLVPAAFADLPGVEYAVGGGAAEDVDWSAQQHGRLGLVIGFVLLLTMLIMAATFRSAPLALVSSLLNLASVGAAFGVLVLVFQEGWLSGALGFSSPGFVIAWLPLFVLVVLVGLSMDYHVFVLSRVREHVAQGLPTRSAVEQGIRDTAGVVTSAAAVMVSVFAIFATLSMLEMKMMGVGLAAAILLDATLVRLVMLPAILVLLGDRAWWPTRPARADGASSEPELTVAREAVEQSVGHFHR